MSASATPAEVYLGIDVGSSSLKATCLDSAGSALTAFRTPVPFDWEDRRADIGSPFIDTLERNLLKELRDGNYRVAAVAVAAVAPAAASVDPQTTNVRLAFSHLDDSGGIDDDPTEEFLTRLQVRAARTRHRLAGSPPTSHERRCALSTALAYRLTGFVAEDSVAGYELGQLPDITQGSTMAPRLEAAPLPTRSVVATTDSIASAYGAGARRESDVLVYFGTYFCALQLRRPIAELLRLGHLESSIPYVWRTSLPRYGDQLHRQLELLLPNLSEAERFTHWDSVLGRVVEPSVVVDVEPAGLRGSAAPPSLAIRNIAPTTSREELLAALGRPFAEALRQSFTDAERSELRFFVEGGAARLPTLRRLTSTLAGIELNIQPTSLGGALGAAQIARDRAAFFSGASDEQVDRDPISS